MSENSEKTVVKVDNMVTVGVLAEKLMIPPTKLIAELMKNGVMVTVNERIDFDTAEIIVGELGLEVELERAEQEQIAIEKRNERVLSENATTRPPVVAVMGHVDHGKTTLIDSIRTSEVAKGEAGGITQHIAAYQIEHNKNPITFLDTPGHEAFAALREHGAKLTDVVIIVVAADDGIKPQTEEAIRYAKKADAKIIVAINKVDKPEADVNRVKQQLAEHGLQTEDWGGDTIAVPVSAKTGDGVDKLLDMVLLVAEVEELKADTDVPAQGLVIETHVEKGRGPVAVVLVESGKLQKGQFVVVGTTYGKVRNLESTTGELLETVGPSSPAIITGLKEMPEFGDAFEVVANEKTARDITSGKARSAKSEERLGVDTSGQLMKMINRNISLQELPVIVKADVKGSLTSVIDSLKTLENEEVAVRIVGSGVGAVNENDLHMAQSSGAIIYAFNAPVSSSVKQHAVRDQITLKEYSVIYELIDHAKELLTTLLQPEVVETDLGRLLVKAVFKTTKTEIICGGEVTKGKLSLPAIARIYRDKELLAEADVTSIKKGPTEVKEALEGEMCGLQLATENKIVLEEGDKIELISKEVVKRTL